MSAIWTALIGASTGALGVIAGFFAPRSRSLDSQRADFDKVRESFDGVLESQREDFAAVLAPVLAELGNLRERVTTLETQHVEDVKQHYKDQRRIDVLVDYVQDLLAFIQLHVPSPPPPPIPPEISQDI